MTTKDQGGQVVAESQDLRLSREELNTYSERGYLINRRQLFNDQQLSELGSIFQEHRVAQSDKRGDEFDTPQVRVVPERNIGHRLWLARGRPVAPNHYENV
jgi:hypothetical protein